MGGRSRGALVREESKKPRVRTCSRRYISSSTNNARRPRYKKARDGIRTRGAEQAIPIIVCRTQKTHDARK